MILAFVYSRCTWECSGETTSIFESESKEAAYLEISNRIEQEFLKENPYHIFIGDTEIEFAYLLGTNMSGNKVDKNSVLQEIECSLFEISELIEEL